MKLFLLSFLFLLLISCGTNQTKPKEPLRIGTTGDYRPFSFEENGNFSGIDFEMATLLAEDLNKNPVFIKTTWGNLTKDLSNNRFDIAMSGITLKDSRKKVGLFSIPYVTFGKLPIARCMDVLKYNTLKKINQPTTRVVVNPGGTNHSFATSNLKKANLIEFPDNNKIFSEIIENRADVMITDSIEVYYQARLHWKVLCPTMKKPLTEESIAIFSKRDKDLVVRINQWLKKFLPSKKKKKLFKKYFGDSL